MRATLFATLALLLAHPAAAQPQARSDAAEYASLHRSLRNYASKKWNPGFDDPVSYQAALLDLNGDGRREAVVMLSGRTWCGTAGCNIWVLTPHGRGWRMVTQVVAARAPIRLLSTRTSGWRDISAVFREESEVRLQVNGRVNPTETPLKRPSGGRVILSDDDENRQLFP